MGVRCGGVTDWGFGVLAKLESHVRNGWKAVTSALQLASSSRWRPPNPYVVCVLASANSEITLPSTNSICGATQLSQAFQTDFQSDFVAVCDQPPMCGSSFL